MSKRECELNAARRSRWPAAIRSGRRGTGRPRSPAMQPIPVAATISGANEARSQARGPSQKPIPAKIETPSRMKAIDRLMRRAPIQASAARSAAKPARQRLRRMQEGATQIASPANWPTASSPAVRSSGSPRRTGKSAALSRMASGQAAETPRGNAHQRSIQVSLRRGSRIGGRTSHRTATGSSFQ